MINPYRKDMVKSYEKTLKIGNGLESCTEELEFHLIELRLTKEEVIIIDTIGLDDGRYKNEDIIDQMVE